LLCVVNVLTIAMMVHCIAIAISSGAASFIVCNEEPTRGSIGVKDIFTNCDIRLVVVNTVDIINFIVVAVYYLCAILPAVFTTSLVKIDGGVIARIYAFFAYLIWMATVFNNVTNDFLAFIVIGNNSAIKEFTVVLTVGVDVFVVAGIPLVITLSKAAIIISDDLLLIVLITQDFAVSGGSRAVSHNVSVGVLGVGDVGARVEESVITLLCIYDCSL